VAKFSVFAGSTLVGYSNLERGDPPMGVAFGSFVPVAEYAAIQRECATNHSNQASLNLTVQSDSGNVIPCVGVSILDYSVQAGVAEIEVNLIGVPSPLYEELFPEHVAAYQRQFP
jgi:hypothetical protein